MAVKTAKPKPAKKDPRATQWKPGQSGNPKGRPPKGHSITEMVQSMMNERPEIKEAVTAKIMQLCLDGDITALKMLWNYMDGMPTQTNKLQVEQTPTPILGGSTVLIHDGDKKALPAPKKNQGR